VFTAIDLQVQRNAEKIYSNLRWGPICTSKVFRLRKQPFKVAATGMHPTLCSVCERVEQRCMPSFNQLKGCHKHPLRRNLETGFPYSPSLVISLGQLNIRFSTLGFHNICIHSKKVTGKNTCFVTSCNLPYPQPLKFLENLPEFPCNQP